MNGGYFSRWELGRPSSSHAPSRSYALGLIHSFKDMNDCLQKSKQMSMSGLRSSMLWWPKCLAGRHGNIRLDLSAHTYKLDVVVCACHLKLARADLLGLLASQSYLNDDLRAQ